MWLMWPRRIQSQPLITKRIRRLTVPTPGHHCLTWASVFLANGPLELGPGLGVSGTTQQSYNQEHSNKFNCHLGWLLDNVSVMAQFLLQGPAQRSACLPGFRIWVFPVQEPQLQHLTRPVFTQMVGGR